MNNNYYNTKRELFLYFINHYEQQCLQYLDYASVHHMTLDHLSIIYEYNTSMIDVYQQELLLLDAQLLLELI